MSLIPDYFNKQLYYEEKYGPQTVILIQRGIFYCCYEYNESSCKNESLKTDDTGLIWYGHVGHASTLSDLLALKLTKPNTKKEYSIKNPDMVGFLCICYDKHLKTLLSNDYVVIRMDQEITTDKDDDGNVPRIVAEIVSPSMNFNRIATNEVTSNIVSIYIEYIKSKNSHYCDGYLITSGVAVLDIVTGNTKITEFYSKANDEAYCVQEIYRFLISHAPKEIIIHIEDMPKELSDDPNINPYVKYLDRILELRRYDRYVIHINKVNKEYKKINYQIEFFNKLYNHIGKNNKIIDELELEQLNYGRLAFVVLIQYCHEYNGPIINLKPPHISWFDQNNVLVLTHNAALCLELIPNFRYHAKKKEEINSLFSILDLTCTNLGSRCLEFLLLNPMVDSKQIESYYDMVDELKLLFKEEPIWLYIDKRLKGLYDIDRLQRKAELKLMTPKDFVLLLRSYTQIIELFNFIASKNLPNIKKICDQVDITNLENFVDEYMSIFDLNELESCTFEIQGNDKILNFKGNPIRNNQEIMNDFDILNTSDKKLNELDVYLNSLLKKGKVKLTNKHVGKNGKPIKGKSKGDQKITFFTASTAVASQIITNHNISICGELKSTTYSATAKIISSSLIEEICYKKDDTMKMLGIKLYHLFTEYMESIIKYVSLFTPLCHLVGKLDVLHAYAKLSDKNKYFRPSVYHDGNSCVKIKDIRHPIIEKLITGEYIVNDLNIGKLNKEDSSPYGTVYYGVNMCGKTSLIKAVALNIIMAQIGCFTPSYMIYRPYTKIITRLTCQDNIFKGESSYEVEITELRTALKQGDMNTLAIFDEVAKSTETQSAICVTVSAIQIFLETKMTFLFSSHLHEIIALPFIADIDKSLLTIKHLSVFHDNKNDILIYDRKIQDGGGTSRYGIEVCKYLKLPLHFLDIANKVSLYLEHENQEFLSSKKSKHNNQVYIDRCFICGTTKNLITHHIQEQRYADDKGFINGMHKNKKDNLIVLCDSCHIKKLHAERKELEVLQTPQGHIVQFKI